MSSPTAPSGPREAAPAPTPRAPPPGYKFIKVKKPDGTIVTVKKKLSPEELQRQQQQQQQETQAPKSDAAETGKTTTTTKTSTASSGVEYKIITVRMPDGTLAKVKRPATTAAAEKPAGSAGDATTADPPPSANASGDDKAAKDTAAEKGADASGATELPELTPEGKEALRDQDLHFKQQRRGRFGTALLLGLVGAAGTVLPDLVDGDEIISDSDLSDDDDDDYLDRDTHTPENDEPVANEKDADMAPLVAAAAVTAAAGVAAAAATSGPPPARQLPNGNADAAAKDQAANGKSGFKITTKDLNELDEKAAQKGAGRPLGRRWEEFSFYLLASLSVVLPTLFIVLGGFIIGMKGKSSESSWGGMVDAIKIAVTVWPIVFAAVTAQGFKTWATYKVERGVKLMELEQLVGSNSFGSVMKQPFVLRRLDLMTLGIFVIWALSPIGSQALLRAYSLERDIVRDTTPVLFAPLLGENMLLSPDVEERIPNATVLSELWQAVSVYYTGAFQTTGVASLESEQTGSYDQDMYNHPLPKTIDEYLAVRVQAWYGLPVVLSPPQVDLEISTNEKLVSKDAQAPFENITFPITSSYFQFTCGEWNTTTRAEIQGGDENVVFSLSETLNIKFFAPNDTASINRMTFATLLDGSTVLNRTNWNDVVQPEDDWKYGVIDCGFEQVFFNSTVLCWIDAKSGSYSHRCSMEHIKVIPTEQVLPEWHTVLGDFSGQLMVGGNPYPVLYPFTPTERWAVSGKKVDGNLADQDPLTLYPPDFAYQFGVLFNTFVGVAHCPECLSTSFLIDIAPELVPPSNGEPEVPSDGSDVAPPLVILPEPGQTGYISPQAKALYITPEGNDNQATRAYSPPGLVFKLDWRWVGVFLASAIVLFLIGVASVILESMLVVPDILGYASSLARNNRYLHLPKLPAKPMSGAERARVIGDVTVIMQDVKPEKEVGKIALGLHHHKTEKLKRGRLYRQ